MLSFAFSLQLGIGVVEGSGGVDDTVSEVVELIELEDVVAL